MDYDYRGYNIKKQHEIASRVILVLVGVVAIAANLFLITTILRFKKLRTRINIYILELSILNTLCTIGFICVLIIGSKSIFLELLLFTEMSLILMHLIFTFLLALDWFLTACKPHWLNGYKKYYGYVHLVIYLLFLTEWIVGMCIYSNPSTSLKLLFFVIVYFFIVMLFLLLNILRGFINVKPNAVRTEYGFTVANIKIFAYLPCLFHHLVYLVCVFYDPTELIGNIFYFITFLPYCIYLGYPIIVVYVLGYLNKYFKTAYKKSFRRIQNYSQEDMDELYLEEGVEENDVPISDSNGKN